MNKILLYNVKDQGMPLAKIKKKGLELNHYHLPLENFLYLLLLRLSVIRQEIILFLEEILALSIYWNVLRNVRRKRGICMELGFMLMIVLFVKLLFIQE